MHEISPRSGRTLTFTGRIRCIVKLGNDRNLKDDP